MLGFLLELFYKYGFNVLNLGLLIFLSWKLFTNHLRHISNAINIVRKKVDNIDKKVDDLSERISKVEGKLE